MEPVTMTKYMDTPGQFWHVTSFLYKDGGGAAPPSSNGGRSRPASFDIERNGVAGFARKASSVRGEEDGPTLEPVQEI